MAQNSEKTVRRRGKGRPFPKGVSGNPGGRPKKRPITEIYEAILADPENLRQIEAVVIDILARRNMASVLMLREMADRLEGKVSQQVEMSGELNLTLSERLERARARRQPPH